MTDITMNSIISVVKDQVSCDLDGESVILSFNKGIYYTLNPIGSRIWILIQNPISVEKVLDIILEEYEISREKCENDVFLLFNDLKKEGLIIIEDSTPL